MSSSSSSRAMLRVLRRMSVSRSSSAAACAASESTSATTPAATTTSTLGFCARGSLLPQHQPPALITRHRDQRLTWTSDSTPRGALALPLPLLLEQLHHRRAIASSAPAAAAAADPPPPPQHSPLQSFVPQIPFSDDELEQLGDVGDGDDADGASHAEALARRRASRRAALAARGELPRGECRRENLPLSWKKLDLATKLVRNRPVEDALAQLDAVPRKSARLLRAAVANAAANAVDAGGDAARLVVARVWTTKGRSTKRLWVMSKGYSSARETRRCHLNVEVAEAPEGAEFLAAGAGRGGARRIVAGDDDKGRQLGGGGGRAAAAVAAAAGVAAEGDGAARDAARELAAARKRRFESARFVAPAAMTRWAAARAVQG